MPVVNFTYFFIKHREEVIDVSIFEYDEEGVMEILREEGRITAAIDAIKNIMTKLDKSADEAMDILDIDIDKREAIKKKAAIVIYPIKY